MAAQDDPAIARESPVLLELLRLDVGSAVAVVGHPIHVMMVHFPIAFVLATLGVDVFYWWSGDPFWVRVGIWSAGIAFLTGVAANRRHGRTPARAWHPRPGGKLVARRGGDDLGRDRRGQLGPAADRSPIDPAARPRIVGFGRGDDELRWLARRQTRLRSWRRCSGVAEELTKRPGPEQLSRKPVGVDVRLGKHNPDDCRDQHDIGGG